ncbi:ATP-binding cassette domain-containing protein [Desulfobacterota bacterium AH_259_B03_O07]|nr:ATP-binding cassette domain-containing protein [Desulfobacterota bacterium AH_259_B03_O07]
MLEIDNISKTFNTGTANEVRALVGINLVVDKGSWVSIIGTNGSGKSALLNSIAGTFMVDSGEISLAGQQITNWPKHKRAGLIGHVFQNPFTGTAPNMSIAENLVLAVYRGQKRGLGWALKHSLTNDFKNRVRHLGLGLEYRLDSPVGTLSGGQRQALTLLMATWVKPKLLLLDEHTAALDPKSATLIIKLSEEIISRQNLTVLMVTHSMEQAAKLGDRLLMLHQGKIIHDVGGSEKKRTRVNELLFRFDELRGRDQMDENTAEMLRRNYI